MRSALIGLCSASILVGCKEPGCGVDWHGGGTAGIELSDTEPADQEIAWSTAGTTQEQLDAWWALFDADTGGAAPPRTPWEALEADGRTGALIGVDRMTDEVWLWANLHFAPWGEPCGSRSIERGRVFGHLSQYSNEVSWSLGERETDGGGTVYANATGRFRPGDVQDGTTARLVIDDLHFHDGACPERDLQKVTITLRFDLDADVVLEAAEDCSLF